ncbi:MAG: hypothetical protein E3J87_02495 [Candidatus Cloacimonadota bacterium]|nr:MAG: hypothetical protein E3J87_02495 [Candidatus Cloacimonadota bacterium]
MILKAAILHKGGRIREKRAKETMGFDHCVRKCLTDAQVKCLTPEEALAIQIINGLRDAAAHYILEISEDELYLHTQTGVTLFRDILKSVFGLNLAEYFPERVLPISTKPPVDLSLMIDSQFKQIKRLLAPKRRKRLKAKARIRSIAIMENSITGDTRQPSEGDLNRIIRRIAKGESCSTLFPGITSLNFVTEGSGLTFSIRISKREGMPVKLVREDETEAGIVAVKRVNELSYYSLGLRDLAVKLRMTMPRLLAVVYHLNMQDDQEYFKEFRIGGARFKRYSREALHLLKEQIPKLDLKKVWENYQKNLKRRRK